MPSWVSAKVTSKDVASGVGVSLPLSMSVLGAKRVSGGPRRKPEPESLACSGRDQPFAGSMVADMEPLQRGMRGSGPKPWI
jgi:hypothetical protein